MRALLFALPINFALFAADFTWDGGEGDGLITSGNNWAGDSAPLSGNSVAFSGNVGLTAGDGNVTIDVDPSTFIFGGIEFLNDYAAIGNIGFVLGGNLIKLDGGITTTATGGTAITDVINSDIELQSNSTLNLGVNHHLSITGNIGEDGTARSITKSGFGRLFLSGNNTFSGGFIHTNDDVLVTHENAFGTGDVTINDSGDTPVIDIDADGLNFDNNFIYGTGGNKVIRLDITGTNSAEISGNITFNEGNRAQSQIRVSTADTLTLSGTLSGSGFTKHNSQGAGTLVITGNNSSYGAGNIDLRAGILRLTNVNAIGSAKINMFDSGANPAIEVAGGATFSNDIDFETTGDSKTFRVQDGTGNLTYTGTINLLDTTSAGDNNIGFTANGDAQRLTLSGLITGAGGMQTVGDGTVEITNALNDFAGDFELGDGASTLRDVEGDGAMQGVVIAHSADVFGSSGVIVSRGSQLRANSAGINFTQDVIINSGGLRLGGANDYEISGNITRSGGGEIGHYGLAGVTYTLSGNIDIEGGTLTIRGSSGKTNGSLVLSGVISDGIAGNNTVSNNFGTNADFAGGNILLSGINTWTGKTFVSGGTLHISQEENLGSARDGGVADFLADRLEINNAGTLNTTATFTIDDPDRGVEFNGASTLDTYSGTTLTIASNVTGSGMTKMGGGNVILSGNNSITSISVQEGILFAGSTTATANTTALTIGSNGTTRLNGNSIEINALAGNGSLENASGTSATLNIGGTGGGDTFSGVIADGSGGGALSLTKTGAGTQALSGENTYTGNTLIIEGTLILSGNLTSAVTVGTLGTLAGEGSTTGNVTFDNLSSIGIDATSTAAYSTSANLDNSGNVTVNLDTAPTAIGNITVLNYGTFSGNVGQFSLGTGSSSARGASFIDDSSNNRILLNLGFETKTWAGGNVTSPDAWDIGISDNWTGGTDSVYQQGDAVVFGNGGIANNDVLLAANQTYTPLSVTFTNSTGDYTLSSGNVNNTATALSAEQDIFVDASSTGNVTLGAKITGTTSITHAGTGNLLIGTGNASTNVLNDFTGLVTVKSGATLIDNSTDAASRALGATTGRSDGVLLIEEGATFDINGSGLSRSYAGYGASSITVSGSGVGGLGAIVNNPANTTNSSAGFANELVLVGNTTFGGATRFDIDTLSTSGAGNYTVTKVGTNTILLQANNNSASISEFVINEGALGADNNNNAFGNALITVNGSGSLSLSDNNRTIANEVILNGGTIRNFGNNQTTGLSGNLTVNGLSFYNPGGNASRGLRLSGSISGDGDFRVTDDGTLILADTLDASGYSGEFQLNFTNARLELEDGVTLEQTLVARNNSNNKILRLQAGATSATVAGGIRIEEATNGNFDINTNGGNLTVSGNGITSTNNGGIEKTGAGTLFLLVDNSYANTTRVTAGTLQIGNGGDAGNLGASGGGIIVSPGATLASNLTDTLTTSGAVTNNGSIVNDGTGDMTFSGVITGNGSLTQNGSGILTLSADSYDEAGPANTTNSFLGDTIINAGTLNLTGEIGGNVTIGPGAGISGEGTIAGNGTVTIGSGGSGSTITIDPNSAGALNVSGSGSTLDVSGGNHTIAFATPLTSGGNITVLSYAGVLTGNQSNFSLGAGLNASARTGGATITSTGGNVTINLGFADITWNGGNVTNPTFWDIATTDNWDNGGSQDVYQEGDFVTFDDAGNGNETISLRSNINAGAINFAQTNGNIDYVINANGGSTLSARGGINLSSVIAEGANVNINAQIVDPSSGNTSITKNGQGLLTLSANNTFSGGVRIEGDQLRITNVGGAGTGTVTLADNGTDNPIFDIRVSDGQTFSNDIVFENVGSTKIVRYTDNTGTSATHTLASNITTLETGNQVRIEALGSDVLNVTGLITGAGVIGSRNTGTTNFQNDTNNFTGNFNVGRGTVTITSLGNQGEASAAGAGNRIALGEINDTGTLSYLGDGTTTNRQILVGLDNGNTDNQTGGGVLLNNGTGALIFNNTGNFNQINGNAADVSGKNLTLGGTFEGTNEIHGVLRDNATGSDRTDPNDEWISLTVSGSDWDLSGNNTYSGNTVIQNGAILRLNGTNTGTGDLILENGGALSGEGSISANATFGSASSDVTTFLVDATTSEAFTFDGNLDIGNGNITVVFEKFAEDPGDGNILIANYNGTLTGNSSNIQIAGAAIASARIGGSPLVASVGGNIVVTLGIEKRTWVGNDGSDPTFWDTVTDNWEEGLWVDGDSALFEDKPNSEGGTYDVELQQDILASKVTFKQSEGDYTLTGAAGTETLTSAGKEGFFFEAERDVTINVGLAGSASLYKKKQGTLTLTGNNTYSLGTDLLEGTIQVESSNALGTGDLLIDDEGEDPILLINAGGLTIANNIEIGKNGDLKTIKLATGNSTLSGDVENKGDEGKEFRIDVSSGATLTFSGDVTGKKNKSPIEKIGAGTLVFSGTNDYQVDTTVSAGTFLVNGTQEETDSTIDVRSGATLGGTGTIRSGKGNGNGSTRIRSGATLAPGSNGVGELTFDGVLDLDAGSTFVWELVSNTDSGAGTNFDLVSFTDDSGLTINENSTFQIDVDTGVLWSDTFWNADHQWLVFDYTADTDTTITTNVFNMLLVSNDSGGNSLSGSGKGMFEIFNDADGATYGDEGVYVRFITFVPEPGTYGMMALALMGFGWVVHRRKRKVSQES